MVGGVGGNRDSVVVEFKIDLAPTQIRHDHLEGVVLFSSLVLTDVDPIDAKARAGVSVIQRTKSDDAVGVSSVNVCEQWKHIRPGCGLQIDPSVGSEVAAAVVEYETTVVVDIDRAVGGSEPVHGKSDIDWSDRTVIGCTH